jgi:3D (Asp-Asp-Asp) domain-containing protein
MKNLVRGGIILSVFSLFVVFVYAQTVTEKTTDIANDSQIEPNITSTFLTADSNSAISNKSTEEKTTEDQDKTKPEEGEGKTKENTVTPAGAPDQKDGKSLVTKTASSKAVGGVSKGKFVATAYCLRGRTASGSRVRNGIIAADPRVLRLGSRVNLGAGSYSGNYIVADTGGKIKGKRIDIWMASCAEARRFGRRTVTVYQP